MSATSAYQYQSYTTMGSNPYLLPKLSFAERPIVVTTEYYPLADGSVPPKKVETADSIKRELVQKLVSRLTIQEARDLDRLTSDLHRPSNAEKEIYASRDTCQFRHLGATEPTLPPRSLEPDQSRALDGGSRAAANEARGRDAELAAVQDEAAAAVQKNADGGDQPNAARYIRDTALALREIPEGSDVVRGLC